MQEKVNTILNKSLSNPDADPKEHALIFEEVSNSEFYFVLVTSISLSFITYTTSC